jgi:hypothetical protein
MTGWFEPLSASRFWTPEHRQSAGGAAARVLPPLTLLPLLADGKVSPDMKWAIAMADRVRAEREQIFQEHTQITDAMNALATAAQKAHDTAAFDFARGAAADSLNDIELLEPMTIVVGDYLKAKLSAAQ